MDNTFLKQSPSGVWLYRRRVPKALRHLYDKPEVCISLETKSLTQARIKRDGLNSEIELKLNEVKSSGPSKARFNKLFVELRSEYLRGERQARETGDENMFSYAYDPDQKVVRGDKTYEEAYYAVLTGHVPDKYRVSVSELFDVWLEANDAKKADKYKSTVKTAKKALLDYLEADEFPGNISPGIAQTFIDRLLEEGRSVGTVTHYKSKIAEVWAWGLNREKFDGVNVWKDVKIEATIEQKQQDHFRNLTAEEAKLLLERTRLENNSSSTWAYPWTTFSLPRLLPFLGCRRGELAEALKEQVVELDGHLFFEVRKGKTKNAERIIPVSPIIEPLLRETIDRCGSSPWLFPEIMEAKGLSSSAAMNSVSSRISKYTKDFEQIEGYKVGMHSLRGHFATALEEIGCPEELAVKLAGHRRLSLTYGLYSKYKDKERLWGYIENIHTAKSLRAWVGRAAN